MIFTFRRVPPASTPSVPTWWSPLGRTGTRCWAAFNSFYEIAAESTMSRCRLWRNDQTGFKWNKTQRRFELGEYILTFFSRFEHGLNRSGVNYRRGHARYEFRISGRHDRRQIHVVFIGDFVVSCPARRTTRRIKGRRKEPWIEEGTPIV